MVKQDEHLQTERDVFPGNDLPRLPGILWKPFPAAQTQETQPITKVIFQKKKRKTTAEPAVSFNVFLFDTKDIIR